MCLQRQHCSSSSSSSSQETARKQLWQSTMARVAAAVYYYSGVCTVTSHTADKGGHHYQSVRDVRKQSGYMTGYSFI
jgi:hypothetical protein